MMKKVSSLNLKIDRKEKRKISNSYIETLDKNNLGSIRNGFGNGLNELGKINKNVLTLSADLTDSLKLTKFKKNFPKNFYQFGISEQNMMSAAAGMTLIDKVPFVCSYAVFNPGRNWDQLRVSVCYSNSNVKIIGGHAGLTTGPDGATHQALEDIAITRVLPNIEVIIPCDEEEARKATIEIGNSLKPTYLRLSREKSLNITKKNSKFDIGVGNVLDEGEDVAIFACGVMVQFALEAREKLKNQGISACVVNMHTIKPIDKKLIIKLAKKCRAILSCEEHQKVGGLGSAISEILVQEFPVPQEIIGVDDSFGESGDGYELLDKYDLSVKEIIKRTKKLIERKNKFYKL